MLIFMETLQDNFHNTMTIRSITRECRLRLQECVIREAGKGGNQVQVQTPEYHEGIALKRKILLEEGVDEFRWPSKPQGKLSLSFG